MKFFSGCLPFSVSPIFPFLPVAYLPYPIALVLPSLSVRLILLLPLSLLLLFLLLLLLFLPWLLLSSLPSVRPPVPSVARFFFSCFITGFCCFLSLFLPLLFYQSSSVASHWRSAFSFCPSPVISSCFSFRSFPFGRRRPSSPVLSFPLLLSYPWFPPPPPLPLSFVSFASFASALSLVLSPPPSFLFFLLLFLLFLRVVYTFFLLSSPRVFSPLLSFFLLLLFALSGSPPFVWSSLVTSCTFGSLSDDPLLFPITDDESVSDSVVFPSVDDGDFVSPCDFFFKTFLSNSN